MDPMMQDLDGIWHQNPLCVCVCVCVEREREREREREGWWCCALLCFAFVPSLFLSLLYKGTALTRAVRGDIWLFNVLPSLFSPVYFFFFFFRCENYAITLLEQCENLEEVETFLQTKTHDGLQHKDANYIMAILDSR